MNPPIRARAATFVLLAGLLDPRTGGAAESDEQSGLGDPPPSGGDTVSDEFERFLDDSELPSYAAPSTAPEPADDPPTYRPRLEIEGYADFGFFAPMGDGSGVREDVGNAAAPKLAGQYGWVFLGDLLSPAINTRGEAADLGDLPGIDRFDSIDSNGALGFVLNEVNLRLRAHPAERVSLLASVNFVPRTGRDFRFGDFIEVEQAQLEWQPFASHPTSVFVGKIEPSVGIEYRDRRADRRFGITPSLLARYTTGTQLGIKVRSLLFERYLIVAASFTNGSSTIEPFHFYDEIDSNDGKTVSGRVALSLPLAGLHEILAGRLELGLSGAWGPQDVARDVRGGQWLMAADAYYDGVELYLRAEILRGGSPGRPVDGAYGLDLRLGGYLEMGWRISPLLGVYGRVELRDALVTLGNERAYLSRTWRGTLGARCTFNAFLAVKAEYLHNGEWGELPSIPNDVFTSSLVATWSPTFGSY